MAWTALEQHAIDVLQELLELKARAGELLPRFTSRATDLEVQTVLAEHLSALASLDLEPVFGWYDVPLVPNPGPLSLALYVDAQRTLDRGRDPALVDARLTQHVLDLEGLCAARCRMLAAWSDTFGESAAAHHLRGLAAEMEASTKSLAEIPAPETPEILTAPWMPWT